MIHSVSISVLVPVYRSSISLPQVVARTQTALADVVHEIILVEDASGDATWETVQALVSQNPNVRGLRLGRNAGQHSALLAGVRAARFTVVVTLDDDLQNPPEEIPRLVEALDQLQADVVYGVPVDAAHAGWRRGSGWLVRRSMKSVLGVSEVVNMSSFRAFRTELRDSFAVNLGPGVSLDALLAWGSSRFASVEVRHDARRYGQSTYSLGKLFRFALDTLTGYTTVPLRITTALGFATAAAGLLVMFVFVLIPFAKGISVQGFPFLASIIILFSGIQLVTLGVMGEYLGRMHFRIMNRPEYVVAEEVGPTQNDDEREY